MFRPLFILMLFAFCIHGYADENSANLGKRLNNLEVFLVKHPDISCGGLKGKDCDKVYEGCNQATHVQVCRLLIRYQYLMTMEYCAGNQSCVDESNLYYQKFINFYERHGDKPGKARYATNKCSPFYIVYPKHEELKTLSKMLNDIDEGSGDFLDYKGLFECVREKYMEG